MGTLSGISKKFSKIIEFKICLGGFKMKRKMGCKGERNICCKFWIKEYTHVIGRECPFSGVWKMFVMVEVAEEGIPEPAEEPHEQS